MKVATCPHCRARIDVSSIVPGGTVLCGDCRNPVRVAEAPAMPMAPVVAPPPPAAPSAAPAPRPAPSRGDAARGRRKPKVGPKRAAPSRGPGARNPVPLLAAFAAVIGLGVAGAFMLFGGNGGKGEDAPGKETRTAAGPAAAGGKAGAPEAKRTELEEAAARYGLEPSGYVDMLVAEAGRSLEKARENHAFLLGQKREKDAARLLADVKRAFPHDPWVNGQLGLVDRTEDINALAGDVEMQDLLSEHPGFQHIVELKEGMTAVPGAGWLDAETSANLDRWIGESRERAKWLRDPVNARSERLYRNLRYDPHFTSLQFDYVVERPWILFTEKVEPEGREAFDRLVRRRAAALRCAYVRFREFLIKDLALEAPPLEDMDDTRLRVFIFRSRRSFDQWHLDTGEEVPSRGMLAYYTPVHQMIVMHAELDDTAGSGGAGASLEASTCIHEAVHHLYDFYQRWYCDRAGKRIPEGYALMSPLRVTPDTLFWFQEGLADWFGAAEPVPGKPGEWTVGRIDRAHVASLAAARAAGQEWKVGEFIFADQAEIYDRAEMKNWGRRGADNLKALMYAHGWLAIHFFLNGEEGRWRKPFLAYVRREIRGDHFRPDLRALLRDLEETGARFQRSEELERILRDRQDISIGIQAWLQGQPEMAKRLRVRDFLHSFGLPLSPEDPKVTAWLREVESGFRAYEQAILRR